MARCWWIPLFALAACVPAQGPRAQSQGNVATAHRELVTVALTDYAAQLQQLRWQGRDIAGVNLSTQTADLIVQQQDVSQLEALGYGVLQELPLDPHLAANALHNALDTQYQTPDKVQAALAALAQQFPAIAAVSSLGKSFEGRDIWAMKISADVANHHPERPAILFNAMHHAREVMSTEVALDTIAQLLNGYGTDAQITHWVNSDEIWVVPMLNVDGNNKVWTADTMWRKNADGPSGVDINRNYPYLWNGCNGSSGSPGDDDYRGTAAASEPETHVLMNLVTSIHPVFDISYHSYSELVLYPYGCNGVYTSLRPVVEGIGKAMAALIPSDEGGGSYTPGTPWEVLYSVDGDDIDWMFHDQNVLPYVIELNSSNQGFQPAYGQWRDATVQKLRPAWQYLLNRLDGSGIRGLVSFTSGAASGATVSVAPSDGSAPEQVHPVNPDGSFQFVLDPGTYHLALSGSGGASQAQDVTVGATRVDLRLSL